MLACSQELEAAPFASASFTTWASAAGLAAAVAAAPAAGDAAPAAAGPPVGRPSAAFISSGIVQRLSLVTLLW